MRLLVEQARIDEVVALLAKRDPSLADDARAAVESLSLGQEEGEPALFTRRWLQLFLWYQLPQKWMIRPAERRAVAEALALFFDQLGPPAAALSALCRSAETARILGAGGNDFVKAMDASGLEPPDTPLLEWGDLMTPEEADERDAAGAMLEDAVDRGELVPGAKGWRERQLELTQRFLTGADEGGATPLARIHTARRESWLHFASAEARPLLETVTAEQDALPAPAPADAEVAVEPLLWLLARLADGVRLTQTGALPRALVREAVERYPHWWPSEVVGPPQRAADIASLELLHAFVGDLKLARSRRSILVLGPRGRRLLADPPELLHAIAATIAAEGSRELDLALAQVLAGDEAGAESPLLYLLRPFNGVLGGWREPARLTAAGRTLAAAVLRERAYGPGHGFF